MSSEWTLGVDLDGVVANYEARMREVTATITGTDPASIPVAHTWSLVESGWPFRDEQDFLRVHQIAVNEHNLYRNMDPIAGASKALWALSDAGIRIRVVTHRLVVNFLHATAVADTVSWLDEHKIPYRDICFVRDKADVGCNLLIDDSPINIASLQSKRGPDSVAIFHQPYNAHLDGIRVHTWNDVLALVSARTGIDLPRIDLSDTTNAA